MTFYRAPDGALMMRDADGRDVAASTLPDASRPIPEASVTDPTQHAPAPTRFAIFAGWEPCAQLPPTWTRLEAECAAADVAQALRLQPSPPSICVVEVPWVPTVERKRRRR